MPRYKVRFARVVIAEEEFEAEDLWKAERKATDMELAGELSIIKAQPNRLILVLADNVVGIVDNDTIWEVEEVGEEPEPAFTTAYAVIREGENR